MHSRTRQFDGVISHGRRIGRAGAAILATFIALAPLPAGAFELFGVQLWGKKQEDAAVVDPLRYTLTFDAGTSDADLKGALEAASSLLAGKERPVSGSLGLLSAARTEREQLVAALYGEARYNGVVDVRIAGAPLDEIALDATFGDGPVPVSVRVTPGSAFTFGRIRLDGETGDLAPARFGLMPGALARSGVILDAEREMVRALKDEGRPLARVANREIVADHDTGTLDVTLQLAAGPVAGYGETRVEGTQQVDRDFTAYMAGLERGRAYSPQELEDARRRLNALDVFSSVAVSEAEALDPSGAIPIDVTVSERKHRYFGIGATISTTDGGGLEGYWGHRNLFGRAEKLRIEGSIANIGRTWNPALFNYNAAILFEKPGVFGPASRFTASLRGNYENPAAYNKFSIDARTGVAYDIDRRQSVSAETRLEWSRVTETATGLQTRHLLVSIPLQYVYDGRDDRLDPTRGVRLLAAAEPTYDIFSGAFFVKARGEASAYTSFGGEGRAVLAGRVAAGSIVGAPLGAVPADRRFYAGGGGSVRGYGFQKVGPLDPATGAPTGGLSYAEASVEMRFRINDRFGIVPFIDAGTVSAGTLPDLTRVQFGAGLGLRYLTPFGPLRIDAAVPLNRRPGDPSFGIYAGIGQAF